jgi:hypothetical protein
VRRLPSRTGSRTAECRWHWVARLAPRRRSSSMGLSSSRPPKAAAPAEAAPSSRPAQPTLSAAEQAVLSIKRARDKLDKDEKRFSFVISVRAPIPRAVGASSLPHASSLRARRRWRRRPGWLCRPRISRPLAATSRSK